jgi:outer membrane protein assembly factor BamB
VFNEGETVSRTAFALFMVAISFGMLTALVDVGQAAPTLKDRDLSTPLLEWSESKDLLGNEAHNPLVVNDMVIVGTDRGEVRAYRCKNGEVAWAHQHGQRVFHAPCSDGERVYFTSANGVTAIAAKDGAELWNFGRASCDGPSLVLSKRELVYVGGSDGKLYALNAKTGKQSWTSDFITDAPADPPDFPGARARVGNTQARPSSLASDGETLFLSVFDQSRLVAVHASDGKRLWSFQAGGWIYGAAVTTDKHVFIGSQDKAFYCLDKQTGKQVWSFRTQSRIESGGVVDARSVYFGSCDGNLYCLNQSDGKERWRFATDANADGRKSAIYSVPILRRGGVCFAAGEGQAYSVDCESGKLNWKFRPSDGSELFCSPATDGARIFVTSRTGLKGVGAPSLAAIGFK